MSSIHSVTVYCSSSSHVPRVYFDAAHQLGRELAARQWKLVYGGNNVGVMGALADSVRAGGGKVIGITPRLFVDKGVADPNCEEFIVCDSMRQRKELMENRGDALVALPGGLGTFEELFEIVVAKQLQYHAKPIVLLNVADYFQPLLAMLEHGIEHKFIKISARDLFFTAPDVPAAMKYLENYRPPKPTDALFSHTVPSAAE